MTAIITASDTATRPSFDYQSSLYSSEDTAATPTSLPRTPTLTLRTMEPQQLNKSADAADRVARIRWLEVVESETMPGERASYQVQLFLEEPLGCLHTPTFASPASASHTVPTTLLQPPQDPATTPSICVTRSFDDFQRLRHAVMDAVSGPHKAYCSLCGDIQAKLTFSSARPAMALWALLPRKTRLNVLNHLLWKVVDEYRKHPVPPRRSSRRRRHTCQGEQQLPVLLEAFLFGERPETSEEDSPFQ